MCVFPLCTFIQAFSWGISFLSLLPFVGVVAGVGLVLWLVAVAFVWSACFPLPLVPCLTASPFLSPYRRPLSSSGGILTAAMVVLVPDTSLALAFAGSPCWVPLACVVAGVSPIP